MELRERRDKSERDAEEPEVVATRGGVEGATTSAQGTLFSAPSCEQRLEGDGSSVSEAEAEKVWTVGKAGEVARNR